MFNPNSSKKFHWEEHHKVFFPRIGGLLVFGILIIVFVQTSATQTKPSCIEKIGVEIEIKYSSSEFSPEGHLYAQAFRNRLLLYDLNTGLQLKELRGENVDGLSPIKFSPGSEYVATGVAGGDVQVWNVATGKFLYRLEGKYDRVKEISFSPSGNLIAALGGSKFKVFGSPPEVKVRVWETATGRLVSAFTPLYSSEGLVFTEMSFSPDGKIIAAVLNNQGGFWEPETGRLIVPLVDSAWTDNIGGYEEYRIGGAIGKMRFSQDGKLLATVGFYWGDIQLWEVPSGRLLTRIKHFTKEMSFTPDSKMLAFQKDKEVRIWDISQHKELTRLTGHKKAVERISFSSDGKLLATSDEKNTILWNTTTWTKIAEIPGARISEFITLRKLATFGPRRYLHVWNVRCG